MDLQEISDRMEITEALNGYPAGMDEPGRDFEKWKKAFTPDAVFVNYQGAGSRLSIEEIKPVFTWDDPVYSHQHLLSNIRITINGDKASSRSEYLHVGVHRHDDPDQAAFIFKGGFYEDEFVRTPEGWRITTHTVNRRWDKTDSVPWPPASIVKLK